MKRFLLLISVLVLCGVLFNTAQAQNQKNVDSLITLLRASKEDTNKVNHLNILAWELMNTNPDSAIFVGKQSLALSEKLQWKRGIASSLGRLGVYYWNKADYPKALEYDFKALKMNEDLGYKDRAAANLSNIGIIYGKQADYPKALYYYFKSLKIGEELGNKEAIANNLINIGIVYKEQENDSFKEQENDSKALFYYFKALKIYEELGNKNGTGAALTNIGNVYKGLREYSKAMDYYSRSLKIREELGNKKGIATTLSNMGIVYHVQNDYPKALDYYFKTLKIAEEQGNKQYQANSTGNIGNIYFQQQDYPKALAYFFKDLKLQQELGIKNGEAMALGNVGIIYSMQGDYPKALDYQLQALKMREELGDKNGIAETFGNIGMTYTLSGKFKEAESYLKKAIALDDSIGAINELRQFEESLSKLYDTTAQVAMRNGQWQMAAEKYELSLMHYKKAIALKDTLFNQEKNNEITRKEMNYEFDKKEAVTKAENEKQLAVAEVEIKKQKLIKYFLIGGLALLLALSYFVYNNFRTASKLKLQNIRNKIASDLHDDVGSTLNSISVYSEVAKQKSPAVVDELEQIGDASRKIIEVMSDIVWTINPNNDTFENIISRMGTLAYNLLKAKNIEHTFQADENLNETKLTLESRRNFYLIFKEALNNLVKYSQATRAAITLTNENGFIKLAIRDNGIGFDVAQTSKGNGLLNMKARAKEMKAELKITSEKGSGTAVELRFSS